MRRLSVAVRTGPVQSVVAATGHRAVLLGEGSARSGRAPHRTPPSVNLAPFEPAPGTDPLSLYSSGRSNLNRKRLRSPSGLAGEVAPPGRLFQARAAPLNALFTPFRGTH